jgi:hypothetical protein
VNLDKEMFGAEVSNGQVTIEIAMFLIPAALKVTSLVGLNFFDRDGREL